MKPDEPTTHVSVIERQLRNLVESTTSGNTSKRIDVIHEPVLDPLRGRHE